MKRKKLFISFALAITSIMLALGLTACDKPHEHSYSEWEVVAEATCRNYGLQKRTCECGNAEYDTIDILPHVEVLGEGIDATCTEFGKTAGSHCEFCDYVIDEQEIIAPLGHKFEDVVVLEDATCSTDGVKRISCINDGCDCYYDESFALPEVAGDKIFADAMQYTGVLQTYNELGFFSDEASAFLINADGDIVASNVTLDNAYSATFKLGETYYDVTGVLAYSKKSRVAVLKTTATGFAHAKVCKEKPIDSETIYIVGALDGGIGSISKGVVSNANRFENDTNYIQHDAVMSEGYVGGPLLNRFGEVVGVNSGYYGSEELNFSVWIAELDNLDYTNPMTMEEYGDLTYTPTEELIDWVYKCFNRVEGDKGEYRFDGENFYYALGYDAESEYAYVEGSWVLEEKRQVKVRVILDEYYGTYHYCASFSDGVWQNDACGYFDIATYDETTVLAYDTYIGRYWDESDIMELYTNSVYDTLRWFSACLDMYFYDLTLESFGFTSLTYETDDEALDKLNAFVEKTGKLNSETGEYVLTIDSQLNEHSLKLSIAYMPETQSAPSKTVVSANCYTTNGYLYTIALTLDTTENGNRFDFSCMINKNGEYIVQNIAWGYLDSKMYTTISELHCYVFEGMNDYEDIFLGDYAALLSHVMGWLDYSVMRGISPELSIKDLGFLFYFG